MTTGSVTQILSTGLRSTSFLVVTHPLRLFNRTTFILKRRVQVPHYRRYKSPNYVVPKLPRIFKEYIEVEDGKDRVYPPVKLILTDIVEDVGQRGQIVECEQNFAYELVLLGKAMYSTPENVAKIRLLSDSEIEKFSSLTAYKTMRMLKDKTISVFMNMHEPWTIEPRHIRANLRLEGVHVLNDDCIQLPEPPIKGPNMSWEGKDFIAYITINNSEKFPIRCRLRHFTKLFAERIVLPPDHFCTPSEPIFPEQKAILDSIPLPKLEEKEDV